MLGLYYAKGVDAMVAAQAAKKQKAAAAALGAAKPVLHPEYGYAHSMVHGVVFPPFADEAAIDEMRSVDWSQDGDIMIATYPKCGTTWMQQIVLLLLANGDAEKVHDPMVQSPWVDREFSIAATSGDPAKKQQMWDEMLNGPADPAFGRRVFKTHATWELNPCGGKFSKGKFIVITRNPKDAALSMHKHYLGLPPFKYSGPWEHFYEIYMQGKVGHGSWFDHVLGWRECRKELGDERVFWITFEEMKADPVPSVRKLADFLGLTVTDEVLQLVALGSSFDSMKAQHEKREKEGSRKMGSANHFRSGKSGGWRDVFTVSQSEALDAELCEKMAGCDDIVTDFGRGVVYRGGELCKAQSAIAETTEEKSPQVPKSLAG